MNRENTSRPHDRMPALPFLVLLGLVLISCWMVSGIYARFTSTDSASQSSQVARFSVTEAGEILEQHMTVVVVPSEEATQYQVVITNYSDVAVRCDLTVDSQTGDLPFLRGMNFPDSGAVLAPGERLTCFLHAGWSPTALEGTDTNLQYMGMVGDLTITVKATQVD